MNSIAKQPLSIQYDPAHQLQHMLGTNGLPKNIVNDIFSRAEELLNADNTLKLTPPSLENKTVFTLFFEPSTRTRSAFEVAAKRLGANVVNLDVSQSATTKGESLLDTVSNLQAMGADIFVVRHSEEGIAEKIAKHVGTQTAVINAGDGCNEHPTQALLDAFTLHRLNYNFSALRIAIVGDIAHSRVARSQLYLFRTLGVNDLRVVGPKDFIPDDIKSLGATSSHNDLRSGLKDVDIIITLRIQRERMSSTHLPDLNAYFNEYGLTQETLAFAKPDAKVLHPGPINRNVEIAPEIADGPQSLILQQVTNGVAVRMAIMMMVTKI